MKNSYIALMADDTPALMTGMLGIMKSGNAFVPVNPVFPDDRVHFILNDLNIKVLLTDKANLHRAQRIAQGNSSLEHVVCIDDPALKEKIKKEKDTFFPIQPQPEPVTQRTQRTQPCYVIYTSGSTGRPKGVQISHANLMPLLLWSRDHFQFEASDRVMQTLSYTFDFGVFEILTTLFFAGTLYLPGKKKMGDFKKYVDFIYLHGIDTIHSTPAFFSNIISSCSGGGKNMSTLKTVHLGGERLPVGMVHELRRVVPRDCRIHNGYGPTETTINSSIFSLRAAEAGPLNGWDSVPIGKPSACNILYVLDKLHRLQPVGVAGELCISGPGLSNGYLNRPQMTREKFVDNPFLPGEKLYRTGDLVRWLPDGSIDFLGRIDLQVKIRGFRIELAEIESCLQNHPRVNEAVVIAAEDRERGAFLCAYIAADGPPSLSVQELRSHLSQQLPDYMIPAYFVQLDRIPLTANGKIDRKALPGPDKDNIVTGAEYATPTNEIEEKLLEIWQDLLGVEPIGINDDFFVLGGDSILASRCIARIREEFQVEISLRKMFQQPFIKALAREVSSRNRGIVSIRRAPRNGDIPLSFPQERLWFLQKLDKNSMAYYVPRAIRITGKLDISLLEQTFTEIIRRHEILRTVFPDREGRPVQRVLGAYDFKIPIVDFTGPDRGAQEQRVSEWISKEGQRRFYLENGPLLRVTLLKLKEEEHMVVLTEHHLIHDGWTQGVLLQEFITIFSAFRQGKPSPLPELPIQYADFALWQRNHLQGEVLEYHLDYWRKKLSGLAPVLELPADRPRPPVISGRGGMKELTLSQRLSTALKRFSKAEGVTLFMTMLTVFKVFLYRYTAVEDLCVGTGIANRRLKEIQGMLGMVINTLALRTRILPRWSFKECLNRVKQTCLEAYEHEDTPLEKVVEVVRPERNLAYTPIFQVMFTFMDTPTRDLTLPGLELTLENSHNRSAKFDINLVVVIPPDQVLEAGNGEILIEWEYNSDIFTEETVDKMQTCYNRLLEQAITRPGEPVSALKMTDRVEKEMKPKEPMQVSFNF